MFGAQAAAYSVSTVHVGDASLEAMRRLAAPIPSGGRYGWAVDVGTGAGFTAFAMADYSHRVLATDPTLPMLLQARRLGLERRLPNLALSQSVAEALPIASESVDLVTSRVAAHHFTDLAKALDEAHRVLKVEGVLVMSDSIAPEDDGVARWMNDVELRRDFSHVKNWKASELEVMLAARGMSIQRREHARVQLQFNSWVERTATPAEQVASLRRDFQTAPAAVKEAFQILGGDGDISFSWPCLVLRAAKS
jgi:SAM-dependent methyltransferase